MIEDWDIPATPREPGAAAMRVVAVIPLPEAMGGSGEVLALAAFGSVKLPTGDTRPRESSYRAATRIALGVAGAHVTPERLVYVVEQPGEPVTLCVLCALQEAEEVESKPGVRFVAVAAGTELEPPALREVLHEDLQGGFVRPVAHVIVGYDESGRERVDVTW
jgi:hypothetical protein